MSTEMENVTQAVQRFDAVAAGISALEQRFKGVVFDVRTTKGLKDAKEARAEIRAPRYEVETLRKAAKAPILELGRTLDARAKRITEHLEALEAPIHDQITAEEGRAEAARQAKVAAELARGEALRQRLQSIREAGESVLHGKSTDIAAAHDALLLVAVDDSWEEFQQQASDAKNARLTTLFQANCAAVQREKDAAELAELRQAQAKQREADERKAAQERAEREDADRLTREAAQKVQAAADEAMRVQRAAEKVEADRIAAENLKLKRERDAALKREADAKAAQEREAKAIADAVAAEDKRRAEVARKAAIRRPTDKQLVACVADHFQVEPEKAAGWLKTFGAP